MLSAVKYESFQSSVIYPSCQCVVFVPGRWLDFAAWSLCWLHILWGKARFVGLLLVVLRRNFQWNWICYVWLCCFNELSSVAPVRAPISSDVVASWTLLSRTNRRCLDSVVSYALSLLQLSAPMACSAGYSSIAGVASLLLFSGSPLQWGSLVAVDFMQQVTKSCSGNQKGVVQGLTQCRLWGYCANPGALVTQTLPTICTWRTTS
mgnify:CR=1 FL=1